MGKVMFPGKNVSFKYELAVSAIIEVGLTVPEGSECVIVLSAVHGVGVSATRPLLGKLIRSIHVLLALS